MSFIATIKTQLIDRELLLEALSQLPHLQVKEYREYIQIHNLRAYSKVMGRDGVSDFCFFRPVGESYELGYDTDHESGSVLSFLLDVKKNYTIAKVKAYCEAHKKRFTWKEENGELVISILSLGGKKLELKSDGEGTLRAEAFGYEGSGCEQDLNQLVDELGQTQTAKRKPEYYLRNTRSKQSVGR